MMDTQAAKARCEAATGGEWIVVDFPADSYRPRRLQVQCGGRLICEIENPTGEDEGNADLIAHDRSDLPAALEALEEAERQRDNYKKLGEVLADTKPGRQRWEKRRAAAIDATPEQALKREKERR